jgi:hypothetical protein
LLLSVHSNTSVPTQETATANQQLLRQGIQNKTMASPEELNVREMLTRPKHASLLVKSQRLIELQEKKIQEQKKQLKDITEKYLSLDIKYTQLSHAFREMEAQNRRFMEKEIPQEEAKGPTEPAILANDGKAANTTSVQVAKINEVGKQIEAEINGIEKLHSLNATNGQFVKIFKDPLRVQIATGGVITDVDPKGDAASQGVFQGDTIVSIDGVPLRLLYAHTKDPSSREISAFINQARKSEGEVRVCFSRGKPDEGKEGP